ncbi:WD40-repeat-containing domain protein [Microdochium trichocladiopsis]|uniref:ASTRA-associated protein 1 n=1 Tax=Microdochium trichocladiopsis TaxID=1682393 RepID=A0A9P8YF39_9PEZI|nr:WD40-repeat-containing domain protein [Microdochium trichocladiopsis]KAH7035801.1 WD40-repeat-containing domain protein [Microdochium trichocladiopsis]
MSSREQAPAPKSVLRGHESQVHVAAFVRHNQRLATGDAEGYVVLWDLTIQRPRAVWRAHSSAILSIAGWGDNRIITHGRDHRLVVWKLTEDDEASLSVALPLDKGAAHRPEPWLLHLLNVNTMNFCAFASCPAGRGTDDELLVAVPNTLASESIDIYHLPSQTRQHTVHTTGQSQQKTGMAMALALLRRASVLLLVVGYENGVVVVAQQSYQGSWDVTYRSQLHTQPVLSLDVSPAQDYFLTSGADALIIKHPIPGFIASPGKDEVTLGPELNGNVATEHQHSNDTPTAPRSGVSLLSSALAGEARSPRPIPIAQREVVTTSLKVINTKHSGQQSLHIRSDGKIFATAGWDSKVRVYSCKTMAELAVLKWHEAGCYATAFADLGGPQVGGPASQDQSALASAQHLSSKDLSVKGRRIRQAKETHWLAAGSKDGKVSLWDIY